MYSLRAAARLAVCCQKLNVTNHVCKFHVMVHTYIHTIAGLN